MPDKHGVAGIITCSFVDWPGKICSVIFMKGCKFRCGYCHNKLIAWNPESMGSMPEKEVIQTIHGNGGRNGWIDGFTVTGGEPTDDPDTLFYLMSALTGYPVKLDTNGSNPEILKKVLESNRVSAVYMDVKAPLEQRAYNHVCGVKVNLDNILRSIQLLKEWSQIRYKNEVVFRTTMQPDWPTGTTDTIYTDILEQPYGDDMTPVPHKDQLTWKYVTQPYVPREEE